MGNDTRAWPTSRRRLNFEAFISFVWFLENDLVATQQISRCALQRIAELVQNIGSVTLAPAVKERMERWVSNACLLL
jgi:hypothetical protein